MNTKDIALMQAKIGTTPDGFWGPQSIAACQTYLRRFVLFLARHLSLKCSSGDTLNVRL